MKDRWGRLWLGVLLAVSPLTGAVAPAGTGWPGLDVAQELLWESQGDFNGHTTHWRAVLVAGTAAEWSERLKALLQVTGPAVFVDGAATLTAPWQGGWVTVAVQAESPGKVQLTWLQRASAAPDAQHLAPVDTQLTGWLPAGSAVFSLVRLREENAMVTLLVAGNLHSLTTNRSHLSQALARDGYTGVDTPGAKTDAAGVVWQAERAHAQVWVTLGDEGRHRSIVVVRRQETPA